ncbi:MAG: PLP-dependent aminotransferase family protein [Blautia hansenii]
MKQDESGMCISSLKDSGAQIAYVMPSHQFPAGTVMPLKRRMALLDWAEEAENRYIIEDDYDSEFRYRGKPIPALQGFDRGGRVIYMGTFSKSIAPSIRVSYMVLPEFLAEQYAERKSPFSVTVSRADQKILELFLKEGGYERHLNRMRAVYKSKHDKMVKVLRDMGDICTFSGEYAGLHLVLEFTNGLTEEEAVLRAEAAGVQVYGYSEYGIKAAR